MAVLSTFAQILLAYFSSSSIDVDRPMANPAFSICAGVFRGCLSLAADNLEAVFLRRNDVLHYSQGHGRET